MANHGQVLNLLGFPTIANPLTTGTAPAGLSVTNSNSTYLNSAGLIVTAANQPRFNHAPKTLIPLGLRTEPARTNLCPQNMNIVNGVVWALQNTTTGTDGVAPDGGAFKLIRDGVTSGSATYNIYLVPPYRPTLTNGTTYTWSAFVKQAPTNPAIWVAADFMLGACHFNIATGATGNVFAGSTTTIENWGDGIYRISVTQTCTATTTYGCGFRATLTDGGSAVRSGTNGANGFYAWGIQIETGSRATSVIPNATTAAISTTADVAVITPVTGFQNYAGTIYVEGMTAKTTRTAAETIASFNDNSVNNRISFRAATTASFGFVDDSGGASQLNATEGVLVANSVFKLAQTYKTGGSTRAVNGFISGASDAYTPATGIDRITLAGEPSGTVFDGHIRNVNWYNFGFTDLQLQQLTT